MLPIDPADGQRGVMPAQPLPPPPPVDVLPAQAMAHGGTFVRPGAVAWGGTRDIPDGAYSSCEAVEHVLAAVVKDARRMNDLLDELARARLWVPLAAGRRPVTDGSAVALPTVTYLGAEFVPCFTSIQRLGNWAGPRTAASAADPGGGGLLAADEYPPGEYQFADVERRWQRGGDARVLPHIVVPAGALARYLPTDLGLALNPGAETSVPIYPEDVAHLAAVYAAANPAPATTAPATADPATAEAATAKAATADPATAEAATADPATAEPAIRVSHPPAEPEALLREVRSGLHALPAVRHASRAWLSVPGQGEGLIISVALEDPASEPAHEAVVSTIEQAVAAVPLQAPFPIDVTFPGESEPDLVDDWVAHNTQPFYRRD